MPCPSFLKLVLPSTLQAKKLRLPHDFVKKYGDSISSFVTLTVPDGSVWHVGLKKQDNKLWFLDGWHDFVQQYSIETGYLLIFRYQGKSCFIVNIYSFATSEINYKSPAQSTNKVPHLAKHLDIFEDLEDESIEMMQLSPTNLTHPLQNKVVSESTDKFTPGKSHSPPALQNMFNGSKLNSINSGEAGNTPSRSAKSPDNQMTQDIGLPFNVAEFKKSTAEVKLRTTTDEKVKKPMTKKRKSDVKEGPSEHEDEVEMCNKFYKSATARKRTVTDEEREKARNEADAFESSNPFCRVVLRPSYLYRGCIMYLPSCFVEKNLNGKPDFIKLQISDGGKQWSVRCLYKDGKAKLSQGWFDFTLDNNLGEGDVCIFELVAAEVLHVTFFRVTEEEAVQQNRLVEA